MIKNVVRSLQTHFPFLQDFRFTIQRYTRKLFNKTHEEDFDALTLFNPPKDSIFLDIGSNRGEAIQSILLRKRSDIKLIGFEPNPLVFKKLASVFGREKQVTLNNFGLGNQELSLDLYIPFYRKWMFDGLASFRYNEAADWLKERLWNYQEKNLSIKKVNCSVKVLDDLNLRPYFVKIDVQGFELQVLQGGEKTISSCHPIFLIESITDSIMSFLTPHNYDFFKFENGKLVQGKGYLNTFCIPKDKHPQES